MAGIESLRGFRTLEAAERERIAAATREVRATAGQVLFSAGQDSDAVWAVKEGLVHMIKHGPGGRDVVLEIVPPGDLFGAVVALNGRPYPASAVVAEPSVVWKMPATLARELCQKHPTLRAAILEHVSTRLHSAHERLCSIALEHVDQRLARQLLVLSEKIGRRENGTTLLHVTRQELADMIGTTVETTIRIASRWQQSGLIRSARNEIALVDVEGLERIAKGEA
ncbi:MAG: Crp/Fnr family transcriptional regulator [Deltaproteobacteria bacterium]|nr:Crp/Fnr family transcriptional regulator [Deltaproteobacteria bacterium]